MAELPDFQRIQYAFAAHIRDPDNAPAPAGIEDRRMAVYRELFFNNLKSLLSNMFPVMKKLHSPERWNRLIRRFMQRHRATTPYFLQLPQEFLDFLQNEYELQDDDFPFLLELAHYEYIELALSISESENDLDAVDPAGDLLDGVPAKSELAWLYAYRYPVHRIAPDFLPDTPNQQPVYLAVYRQPDDKVGFLELNALSAALLSAIEANEARLTGTALLQNLARESGYPDEKVLLEHGRAALEQMRDLHILTGTQKPA